MEKKIEIVSEETIKPSSQTPDHLRNLTLSLPDILTSPFYTGALLFYIADHKHRLGSEDICLKLKKSLSETLTTFYPLAGRINGKVVDCNDEGAVFIEARIHCLLSDFFKNLDPESLESLIPAEAQSAKEALWPVLLIQANFFSCGGLAITICTSHKITDATSLFMFIRGWAASTKGLGITMIPEFTASNFFPPPQELPFKAFEKVDFQPSSCLTKRFVFDGFKIAELKNRSVSELVKNPTRVEAVTALFWRCATKASRSNSETQRTSILQLPLNIRRRVASLSENTIGNLLSLTILKNEQSRVEKIQEVVAGLRRIKEEFDSVCNEKFVEGVQASSNLLNIVKDMEQIYSKANDLDLYTSNSWCNLHIYEADFGWGKPIWVTGRGTSIFKNLMLLIDAKDGKGIDAWITLTEEDMLKFEHDEELLEYASPNPPVLI